MKFEERVKGIEEEFNRKIDELKEEFKEKGNSGYWTPEYHDEYYFIDDMGEVAWTAWGDYYKHDYRLEIGNVFKTEEEAEFEIERLKVLTEMKKYSKPFSCIKDNYYIYYASNQIRVDECDIQTNDIYFENEKMARKAINEIGEERIKKYYLRVKE